MCRQSVLNLKRGAVLRSAATFIIQPRRGYISMTEPGLHAGNVGFVVEGVGGCGRAKRMRRKMVGVDPDLGSVTLEYPVYGRGMESFRESLCVVVSYRTKQRSLFLSAVTGLLEVLVDEPLCSGMDWHVPDLTPFPMDTKMHHVTDVHRA